MFESNVTHAAFFWGGGRGRRGIASFLNAKICTRVTGKFFNISTCATWVRAKYFSDMMILYAIYKLKLMACHPNLHLLGGRRQGHKLCARREQFDIHFWLYYTVSHIYSIYLKLPASHPNLHQLGGRRQGVYELCVRREQFDIHFCIITLMSVTWVRMERHYIVHIIKMYSSNVQYKKCKL